jgi:diaminopimelate decarboxylase
VSDITDKPRQITQITQLMPDLSRAADKYGTPVYVIDMASVDAAARQIEAAFGGSWLLHYSLKANDLPAITGYLARRGWGGSVVSTGEWQYAAHAGLANDAIAFEGIGKTDAQLEHAVAEAAAGRPVRWLVLESAEETERLSQLAASYRLGHGDRPPLDVLVRLNPAVAPETRDELAVGRAASKFGLPEADIRALVRRGPLAGGAAAAGLRLRGIHVHIGSALADVGAWSEAGLQATRLLAEINRHADTADTVDFGGGFPLPGPGLPGPAEFRQALLRALTQAALTLPPRPAIEPGRYLVGQAGWLVSRVLHVRRPTPVTPVPEQVVLDAGMTELMRPALYGSVHSVHAIRAVAGRGALRETVVEGPVCESTDSFGIQQLPPLKRDDLVAIDQAGAYAASFTSRYNGRPQPTEVLLWPDGSLQHCRRPDITAPVMPSTEPGHSDLAPALTRGTGAVLRQSTTNQLRHCG